MPLFLDWEADWITKRACIDARTAPTSHPPAAPQEALEGEAARLLGAALEQCVAGVPLPGGRKERSLAVRGG